MGTRTKRKPVRAAAAVAAIASIAGIALCGDGAATAAGFADVPPWHWAYDAVTRDQDAGVIVGYPTAPATLVENAITQVFDGFAHASANGALAWVERFSYDLPPDWPVPFRRSQIVAFSFTGMHTSVGTTTATAEFSASVGTRDGRSVTIPLRVGLRQNGQDWQVDYAVLARASPLFR